MAPDERHYYDLLQFQNMNWGAWSILPSFSCAFAKELGRRRFAGRLIAAEQYTA
jgi:hypothetical protein